MQRHVTVLEPNGVPTMNGVVDDGSVKSAIESITDTFQSVDSNNRVRTVQYGLNFDDALDEAGVAAGEVRGGHLFAIITDLVAAQPRRCDDLISNLTAYGNIVFVVLVADRCYDDTWVRRLLDMPNVYVIHPGELSNSEAMLHKIEAWIGV